MGQCLAPSRGKTRKPLRKVKSPRLASTDEVLADDSHEDTDQDPSAVQKEAKQEGVRVPSLLRNLSAQRFTLDALRDATQDFDESLLLGEGSFGRVFRGVLSDGTDSMDVAVKLLHPESLEDLSEWVKEILLLDRLRHPNLSGLVGFCAEDSKALLVYELCHRGSLAEILFSDSLDNPGVMLSWKLRVKIALDAAEGLSFLHANNVIHRDFKPSNIVLDNNFTARLTDFGMAKEGPGNGMTHVSTRVMGTLGYLDPEYGQTGHLTHKSDVYSFGVMLLELITGKRSRDGLAGWARPLLADWSMHDMGKHVDPTLEGNYSISSVMKMFIIAKYCINDDPCSRPEMSAVTESLRKIQEE